MPATAKLYETDPYVQTFTATVLVCTPAGEQFAVQLDRTAFYPEGGGQPCDTGALGTALVTDVQEHGGVITHTVSAALPVGQTVEGRIDWARRRDHMEQHTGEHILSGTLHRLFGAENVGFHIGSPAVRMDMSVPLTAGQLAEAEAQANAVIRADAPVRCWYPAPEDLAKLTYRSKKEIDGAVRLVDAGGADLCACCGTHVSTTGQVGAIKILSAQSYKGGTRLAVVCGERAHQSIAAAWQDAAAVGTLLSSAPVACCLPCKTCKRRKLPSSSALPPCRTHCPKHWPKPPCPASLLCCTVTVRTATDCGGSVWRYRPAPTR